MNISYSVKDSTYGKQYYTDENGDIYMSVNVLGHVKSPGSYKVYVGSDILTVISNAGGPLPGAQLDSVIIYKTNSSTEKINLEEMLESTNQKSYISIEPNNTVYVKQASTYSEKPIAGGHYYIDSSGNNIMYINVTGHVKNPGSYLVHEGSSILTVLAQAGGALNGSKSKVTITSNDGKSYKINLQKVINDNDLESISLNPNDTIHVEETVMNYVLSKANIFNVLLQITNLILITTG